MGGYWSHRVLFVINRFDSVEVILVECLSKKNYVAYFANDFGLSFSSLSLAGEASPGLGCLKTPGLLSLSSGCCSICSSLLLSISRVKFDSSGWCGSSGMFNGPFNAGSSSSELLRESMVLTAVLCRVGVSSIPSYVRLLFGGGVGG